MTATPETARVLADILDERGRQIEKGWTPEHDDRHSTHDLVKLAEGWAHKSGSLAGPGYYARHRLVQAAAILVAAIEAWDRRGGDRR